MALTTGSKVLMELLKQEKVEYVFGLPGSTDLLFLDALEDHPEITYILGLHEVVALGMAEGYARFSGKVGVVNLHSLTGLAAALPMLFNAYWERVPLVIIAGVWDTEVSNQVKQPASHMVDLARLFTKWQAVVTSPANIPQSILKAFKMALQPPSGPVFVALPQDILGGSLALDNWPEIPASNDLQPDDTLAEMDNSPQKDDFVSRLTHELKKQVKPNAISQLLLALKKQVLPGTIIIEECPSYTTDVRQFLADKTKVSYFNVKPGRSIGGGLPNAIGARLAAPDHPVIAVIGDGCAIWSIQSLWTAAHYHLPVTFIITANTSYRVLKMVKIGQIGKKARGRYLGLNFDEPRLDFCRMAESMGVAAKKIEQPEEITKTLQLALRANAPYLLEIDLKDEI